MTIQEAIADGWSTYDQPSRAKIGDTIQMLNSRPFVPFESDIIGWDRWGTLVLPRFRPLDDQCQVVLQSQEDLDFFRRQHDPK